jgi:16S rRNA (guanine966-N2)-methyltransferase
MSAVGPELPGARVLDLFAGSGALGLEAISRGAAEAVFVERGRDALAALRDNVAALGAGDEATVVVDDVFRFLERPLEPFDVAFADPPYGTGDARALVERFLARPFARTLWLEHPWREELPLPSDARTRRYGDTGLTTLRDHDATGTDDRPT